MNNTIIKVRNRYFNIFNDFCDYWHSLSEIIVEWEPFSYNEILVMSETDAWIYNYSEKTLRRMYRRSINDLTEEEWRYDFSIVLRRRLNALGMSSTELSELTGISTVMLSRYLNGKVSPSAYNIAKIAAALECTASSLIDKIQ